jgi:signal transduction histidine kinase/ligand-binding sensor domain-containing protein
MNLMNLFKSGFKALFMKLKTIIFFFFLLVCILACYAREPFQYQSNLSNLQFSNLSTKDGLPHSTIRSFYQDSKGFMWIGTGNGLAVYDGLNFTVYNSNIFDDNSLEGNTVTKMMGDTLDGEEGFWVLTIDNISFFNLERKRFKRIPRSPLSDRAFFYNNIRDMFRLPNGDICILALNGLYAIDRESLELYIPEFPFIDQQWSYYSGMNLDSVFIIGTSQGLLKYKPGSGNYEFFDPPEGMLQGTSLSNVSALACNGSGVLFFGNADGLFKLSLEGVNIQRISLTNGNLPEDIRSLFYQPETGILWIATHDQGIFTYNENDQMILNILSADKENSQLTSSIFIDNKQVLWIGRYQGGVYLADLLPKSFYQLKISNLFSNKIYGFEIIDGENTLAGGGNGLIWHFNRKTGTFSELIQTEQNPFHRQRNITGPIFYDHQNRKLWVGSFSEGLMIADLKLSGCNLMGLQNIRIITPESGPFASLKGWSVRSICKDNLERIWVGTIDGGITLFTPDGRTISDPEMGKNLNNYFPRGIRQIFSPLFGWDDFLLITDFRGVHLVDIHSGIAVPLSERTSNTQGRIALSRPIWSVYQQDFSTFWLASANTGLIKMHLSKTSNVRPSQDIPVMVDSVRIFHASENFPTNLVYKILPDSKNNLWISSEVGLIKFNTKDFTWELFNRRNGLDQLEFHFGAAALDTVSGFMYFGGTDGITWFHPEKINPDPIAPTPVISSLDLFASTVKQGDTINQRFILRKDIPYTDTLIFRHKQNVISFGIAALKYSGFRGNRCAYRMEGFDSDWRFTSSGFEKVTYTNLNPGSYVLRVRALNADNVWSEDETIMFIMILPPWWRTPWAYILWIMIFILMMDLFRRMVRMRERLKSEIKLQRVEIEKEKEIARKTHEIDQMKIRFFTNISHEFRTPLTLILGPLDHLVQTLPPKEIVTEQIEMIRRNARRLLRLINQLLDLQKLEKSSMNLTLVYDDIIPFIKNLFYSFESFAREKQIEYTLVQSIEKLVMPFDPDVIEKSLSNLLSNALKFTPSKGKVKLTLQTYHKTNKDRLFLKIIVEDSGQGIPASEKAKIFRPFYRYENLESAKIPGTGIGLSITRELIDLHKGKIRETGKEGKGGVFEVRLPAYTDAYKGYNIQDEKTWHDVNVPVGENPGIAAHIDHYQVSESASQEPSCKSKTVLVIDDNSDILHYLGTILKDSYNLLYAKDGKEGIGQSK